MITTAGDSQGDFVACFMHSIVYSKAQKNNLIDFIPDSVNANAADIPTFLGRRVVVDDSMPNAAGVFDTWIFGSSASRWGVGNPKVPAEIDRVPSQGNGGGAEDQDRTHDGRQHRQGLSKDGAGCEVGQTGVSSGSGSLDADERCR